MLIYFELLIICSFLCYCVSFFQRFFSKKGKEGMQAALFLFNAAMWTKYSFISGEFSMIFANGVAGVLGLGAVLWQLAKGRGTSLFCTQIAGCFLAIYAVFLLFFFGFSDENIFGRAGLVSSLSLFISPCFSLSEILSSPKERANLAASAGLGASFSGLWLLYGMARGETTLAISSGMNAGVLGMQLFLCISASEERGQLGKSEADAPLCEATLL